MSVGRQSLPYPGKVLLTRCYLLQAITAEVNNNGRSHMLGVQIFGAVLGLGGAWVVIHERLVARKIVAAQHWPTVRGEILSSDVKDRPGGKGAYRAKIEFRYSFGGADYKSRKITMGGEVRGSKALAAARCKQFPVGATPDVHVNPDKPAEAFLELRQEGRLMTTAIGALFTVLGIGLATGLLSQS